MNLKIVVSLAITFFYVIFFNSNVLWAKELKYSESGRLKFVNYAEKVNIAFEADLQANLNNVVFKSSISTPKEVFWEVSPRVGEIKSLFGFDTFLFKVKWVHVSEYIVNARLRYRLVGSLNWISSVMTYKSGVPSEGAEFELKRLIYDAGIYEFQFSADASDTESVVGLSSEWLPSLPLQFTVLTADTDSDGYRDDVDNCPSISNVNQSDFDGDKLGDICDPDDDNDGLFDDVEIALGTNKFSSDTDGDGVSDFDEIVDTTNPADSDGDGKIDAIESSIDDADGDGIFNQEDSNDNVKYDEGDILDFLPAIISAIPDSLLKESGKVFQLGKDDFDGVRDLYTFTTEKDFKKITVILKRLTGFAEFGILGSDKAYLCPPELQSTSKQICIVQNPGKKVWQINVYSLNGSSQYELAVTAK